MIWRSLWRLAAAFGIYGLAVWPAAAWLSYDLVSKEVATVNGLHVNSSTRIGRDFVNIWHGGREARQQGAATVYDRDAYRRTLRQLAGVKGIYAFSYPPHMLALAIPFGWLGYVPALLVWSVGGLVLFVIAAAPWLRDAGLPAWGALILPGGVVNLWAGHFGFLIGALALIGYRHAASRPALAGSAFALMTVKPHLGVFVPLVLGFGRQWRTIGLTVLFTATLVVLSVLLLGPDAWRIWIGSTLGFQAGLIADHAGSEFVRMMPTVHRAVSTVASASLANVAQIGAGLITAFSLIALGLRKAHPQSLALAAMVGTYLALPYVFTYDMTLLSLIALIAAVHAGTRWWSPAKLLCGAAFIAPLAQVPLAKLGLWLSPVAVAALFCLLLWRGWQGRGAIL